MYRVFFKLVLQRIDPERAHSLARTSMRAIWSNPLGRALLRGLARRPDPILQTHAFNLTFTSPLGVAAGLDKHADWFEVLGALGFGFVEVGTITALAQDGNPRPRISRDLLHRSLVNRMGFPNPGAARAAETLRRLRSRARSPATVVGVNVGKSKAAPLDGAADDYRQSIRRLAPAADYLVLNVSSPNTPGLRELQALEQLRQLVAAVREELAGVPVPLLVKLAPDLGERELGEIAALAVELELDGIVAVNTTVDRSGLGDDADAAIPFEGGGVSGAPLAPRAVEVLRVLRARVGEHLVLISVGGIETADDVLERIRAGATLVQAYTAFVYGGPSWPASVNRELARRVRAAGASSIQALVGREDSQSILPAPAS